MREIGGYFELELPSLTEYHEDAIRLNTARNAFEYLLQHTGFSKIFIPFFTCDAVLEPIKKLKIDYAFYHIDENFEPVFNFEILSKNEAFLYTNYFGLKDEFIVKLSKEVQNLMIDNAQSFYSKPTRAIGTFYSPRKFFGIPDGGYLYLNEEIQHSETVLEKDVSVNRFAHLLKRTEFSAQEGYQDFVVNDNSLSNQPIKKMSAITVKLLKAIDYEEIAVIRRSNFLYLQEHLKSLNKLNLVLNEHQVPMVYPFWNTNPDLKKELVSELVFTATYWPNVLEWTTSEMLENSFVKEIVHLPVDQRYSIEDLNRIIDIIKKNER